MRRELGERGLPTALATLIAVRLRPAIERERRWSATGALLACWSTRRILLRRSRGPVEELVNSSPGSSISAKPSEARAPAEVRRRARLGAAERALGDLTATWVDSNVYSDAEATQRRRQEAADRVPPVDLPLCARRPDRPARPAGAARAGAARARRAASRAQPERVAVARADLPRRDAGLLPLSLAGYHQRAFRKIRHLHSLLVLMMLSMLLLARAMLWVAANVVDALERPFSNPHDYTYLIPLGPARSSSRCWPTAASPRCTRRSPRCCSGR